MIATFMTMAPRDELVQSRCLDSLLATGFGNPYLFAEPGTDIPDWFTGVVVVRPHRYGLYNNWLHAARETLLREPRADWILACQDDIVFCRNVYDLVRLCPCPDVACGAIHLYTSKRYGGYYPSGKRSMLVPNHQKRMAAACAILFRRDALEAVCRSLPQDWKPSTVTDHMDVELGKLLLDLGYTVWVHVPSLAQTIAKGSTLGHGGPMGARVAASWPGENADALELFKGELCRVAVAATPLP